MITCCTGYTDNGDVEKKQYESKDFEHELVGIYDTIRPLYEQLHAYFRPRIQQKYPDNLFPSTGHMPAHLFGLWPCMIPPTGAVVHYLHAIIYLL